MKLKCVRHKRRVHVLDQGVTVHREDGTRCGVVEFGQDAAITNMSLEIGGFRVTPYRVWLMKRNKNKRWRDNHKGKGNRRSQFDGRSH